MTIETGIIAEEVGAEAGIGMNVTDIVGETEIIADEAEAGVLVLIIPEAEAEAGTMMIAEVLVDQLAGIPKMPINAYWKFT